MDLSCKNVNTKKLKLLEKLNIHFLNHMDTKNEDLVRFLNGTYDLSTGQFHENSDPSTKPPPLKKLRLEIPDMPRLLCDTCGQVWENDRHICNFNLNETINKVSAKRTHEEMEKEVSR
jgi:hypothetical protein